MVVGLTTGTSKRKETDINWQGTVLLLVAGVTPPVAAKLAQAAICHNPVTFTCTKQTYYAIEKLMTINNAINVSINDKQLMEKLMTINGKINGLMERLMKINGKIGKMKETDVSW